MNQFRESQFKNSSSIETEDEGDNKTWGLTINTFICKKPTEWRLRFSNFFMMVGHSYYFILNYTLLIVISNNWFFRQHMFSSMYPQLFFTDIKWIFWIILETLKEKLLPESYLRRLMLNSVQGSCQTECQGCVDNLTKNNDASIVFSDDTDGQRDSIHSHQPVDDQEIFSFHDSCFQNKLKFNVCLKF